MWIECPVSAAISPCSHFWSPPVQRPEHKCGYTHGVPDMSSTSITNHIRRLRFEHDEMTQQDLADRIGATRQTVHAIEAAKYAPSLELAFRISRVFGLGVEDVFEYREDT